MTLRLFQNLEEKGLKGLHSVSMLADGSKTLEVLVDPEEYDGDSSQVPSEWEGWKVKLLTGERSTFQLG